jgi:hypothetical protein
LADSIIYTCEFDFRQAHLFNAIGTPGTQSDFARWGYPRWWSFFTGGLEITSAVLIALPASRIVGLALGAVIIAAAVMTVLRHRDLSHLWVYGVGEDGVLAFTDFGIESLIELIKMYKDDPTLLKR